MAIDSSSNSKKDQEIPEFNVIVADTAWETFEQIPDLGEGFNFLNLSSDFAVNFILEYEKIDMVIISRRISGLDSILRKAQKKKAKVLILGEDIEYPLDSSQLGQLLEKERVSILESNGKKKTETFVSFLRKLLGLSGEQRLHKHAKKDHRAAETSGEQSIGPEIDGKNENKQKEDDIYQAAGHEDYEAVFWGEQKTDNRQFDAPAIASHISDEPRNNGPDFEKSRGGSSKNDRTDLRLQNYIAIKQKIIVFLKAKGGVGSTLLSLFLAYHFRKLKTLLVDLNFCEGGSDIGYYLNIPKSPNMIVFIEGYNRNAMDNSVVNIKENLDVLQAPPTYELSKKMDLQDIYSMVDVARKKYHLIIFDLPNQINDIYLGVLDIADLAVMVSDFTVGSIGRLISINKRFIYDDLEKMLVLNRNRNGNSPHFISNYIEEFFNPEEVVVLGESDLLNKKIDFDGFNFSRLKEFSGLAERILERLTCE